MLSKLLSRGLERSPYLNEYEIKTGNKNTINECRYFLKSNFAAVKRMFLFIEILKGIRLEGIIYQKILLIIITSSSMERTFMTN